MANRAQLHETVRQELEAKQHKAQQKGSAPAALAPAGTRPVLMAVASKGGGVINQHFGHAREFLVYEASPAGVRFIGHRKTELYCSGGDTCGEAESSLDQIIRSLEGCEVVLCSKVGHEPWEALEAAGIQPNGEHGMEPIEEAVATVYRELARSGRLQETTARVKAG
jgi:nitrogen fixation protein NifB